MGNFQTGNQIKPMEAFYLKRSRNGGKGVMGDSMHSGADFHCDGGLFLRDFEAYPRPLLERVWKPTCTKP